MSLNFAKVQPEDIKIVVKNMWERGQRESKVYGFDNTEDIMAYLLSLSGEYGYVMKVGDEPIAVFGAARHEEKYSTWFVATERFNEVGKQATLFLNGFIKERVKDRPDAELEMISAVEHPEAERWFAALGFALIEKDGLFSKYKYRRNRLTKASGYVNISKADSDIRHVVDP